MTVPTDAGPPNGNPLLPFHEPATATGTIEMNNDISDPRGSYDDDDDHDNSNDNNDNDNDDNDDDGHKDDDRNNGTADVNLTERLATAMKKASSLLQECGTTKQKTMAVLERARELAAKAGLTVDSYVVAPHHPPQTLAYGIPEDHIVNGTIENTIPPMGGKVVVDNVNHTGAYSNTDHHVQRTGDKRADRIAELKRHLLRRHRSMRPEDRGEERWDKPKLPGERRRRIVREKDLDIAPPEPPATGWIAFLSQMTLKIRHDRPKGQHDQAKILQEISKLYRLALSEEDREYYVQFARDANKEYQQQLIEFRATGSYRPSSHFYRFRNANVWVRTDLPNPLEQEIIKYEKEEDQDDGMEDGNKEEDVVDGSDDGETSAAAPYSGEEDEVDRPQSKRLKRGDDDENTSGSDGGL